MRAVLRTFVHSCTHPWGRRGSLVRSCACNCVHLSTSMVQVGQYCAQLYIQMCTFVHKHGVKRRRCTQLCLQLCTVVHKHGADGAVLCAVAHAQCTLIVVLVPWVVGWAVRTYVRTYFLSLCGLAAMGRRSGRVFFLVVVLVPWVAGWAVLSFSLRSWCHGSSAGQCFLSLCSLGAMGRRLGSVFFLFVVLAPWVVGWAMFSLSWAIGRRLGSLDCRLDCRLLVDFWLCYVRTNFSILVVSSLLNGPRTGHFFLRQFRPEDVSFSSLRTFAPSERVSNGRRWAR